MPLTGPGRWALIVGAGFLVGGSIGWLAVPIRRQMREVEALRIQRGAALPPRPPWQEVEHRVGDFGTPERTRRKIERGFRGPASGVPRR